MTKETKKFDADAGKKQLVDADGKEIRTPEQRRLDLYNADTAVVKAWQKKIQDKIERTRNSKPPAGVLKAYERCREYEAEIYAKDAINFRLFLANSDDAAVGFLYHQCMDAGFLKKPGDDKGEGK